tara:strand:+ start:631 stop:855 length:225 start_codon:yes stop_codon:yes gene_type:complete
MKVKDLKLDNGKEHLFGVLKKETGTIKYVYEYLHQIPLAMGCYLKDFYKKDSKYKLVKFRITDVKSVTLKEAKL